MLMRAASLNQVAYSNIKHQTGYISLSLRMRHYACWQYAFLKTTVSAVSTADDKVIVGVYSPMNSKETKARHQSVR